MTSADEDAAAHGYLLPLIEFMAGDVGVLKTKSSYGLVIGSDRMVILQPLKLKRTSYQGIGMSSPDATGKYRE